MFRVDSAVAELNFAMGFVGARLTSDFILDEPFLNENLEPKYTGRRYRTPDSAPYERGVEEEGLLKFVEPHWLMLKQPSQQKT